MSPKGREATLVAARLALAVLLELLLRAKHPPAASTTLLVALGSFHPTWHDAWVILAGVAAAHPEFSDVMTRLHEREAGHTEAFVDGSACRRKCA